MNWIELIGSYGFPIIACIYVFWATDKERTKMREENIIERDKDRAERKEQDKRYDAIAINLTTLTEAVNNNTQALLKLINQK